MPGILVGSNEICVYVTEACNSNCVMCPMSLDSRKRGNVMTTEEWDLLRTMNTKGVEFIVITGGEPFLVYERIAESMRIINERFSSAEVLVLTNGRVLSIPRIYDMIAPLLTDRYTIAIPIHGPEAEIHDMISQTPGSFLQSIKAIRRLEQTRAWTEIRIVGNRLNLDKINDTFRMLTDCSRRLKVINLIGMEMTGCAARNRESLWVPYEELCLVAEPGINYAVHHGVNVGLYNFPLCTIPQRLWPLAKQSITPYKVRFDPKCELCREKPVCGGMFNSVFELKKIDVRPFLREE